MTALLDNRLLLRRVDVLAGKMARYERELETMPDEAREARYIMQGILADLYAEQRQLVQYANEISPPYRDYLEGFA
jgi:hypothetical protein